MKIIQDLIITVLLIIAALLVITSDGQSCIDTVNAMQSGNDESRDGRQVIIPRNNFSCNGRITGYLISLDQRNGNNVEGAPTVQVWHPISSTEYTRVNSECPLTDNDISMMTDTRGDEYYLGNVSCTGNNRIEFQSGDVIGYHQGDSVRYRLWNVNNNGYTAYYYNNVPNPLNTFNINDADDTGNDRQPLIQVMYDIQCDDLSTPANGEITSFSSGRVGVGYEGDTCSFTCNIGYELTGSDTRTCQSDGSWSGRETMCNEELLNLNEGKALKHSVALQDNAVYESSGGIIKNLNYSNTTYYSSADVKHNNQAVAYREPAAYLNPVKSSTDDYETYIMMNVYELPHNGDLYTTAHIPDHYEKADSPTSNDNEVQDFSNSEPIYEDPGHSKENIYEWLEQRGILKLDTKIVRILHEIGSGEFGVVNLGLWSNGSADPVQVAVKTLNSQCSESDRVKFLREAAIMGQFVHNNVVQLHGVVTEEENVMIVLEYMPKGDLHNYLLKIKPPVDDLQIQETNSGLHYELLSYCRQISAGMNYLTTKRFVHRDLAARNVLLSSENVCKIADFGMARDVTDDIYYVASGGKIPVKWTAPEAIFYKKYSVQSDVWSFGCVMYEIWSLGHTPFEDLSGKEYLRKITTGYRLPPSPGCPRAMYELMIQCWHPESKGRPQSKSVLRTLQKSDETLLQCSAADGDKNDSEMMMSSLGAPLATGEHLYPDLQSQYTNA